MDASRFEDRDKYINTILGGFLKEFQPSNIMTKNVKFDYRMVSFGFNIGLVLERVERNILYSDYDDSDRAGVDPWAQENRDDRENPPDISSIPMFPDEEGQRPDKDKLGIAWFKRSDYEPLR